MDSLLEKADVVGKVQIVCLDPHYGKYRSNLQFVVTKRDLNDGNDENLTAEPEQIKWYATGEWSLSA
jgi:adenine-specific DNA-methyltransferase